MCDLEYPNLVTKSAKVFSTPSAILQVLSDTVNGDIFSHETVVSVVDTVMEASNSMLLELSDDVVMNVNTNPRLSRPGSKSSSKPGLSRRPRVDRSPSRASSMSSHGSGGGGMLLDGTSRNNSFASVGSDGGGTSINSHRGSPKSTKSSPVIGSSYRHDASQPMLVRSTTMSAAVSVSASASNNLSSSLTRDPYIPRPSTATGSNRPINNIVDSSMQHMATRPIVVSTSSNPNPNPTDVASTSGPATTGSIVTMASSPLSRGVIERGVPVAIEREHDFPSKPEMRRAKSERGARRQADLFS